MNPETIFRGLVVISGFGCLVFFVTFVYCFDTVGRHIQTLSFTRSLFVAFVTAGITTLGGITSVLVGVLMIGSEGGTLNLTINTGFGLCSFMGTFWFITPRVLTKFNVQIPNSGAY